MWNVFLEFSKAKSKEKLKKALQMFFLVILLEAKRRYLHIFNKKYNFLILCNFLKMKTLPGMRFACTQPNGFLELNS